MTAGLRARIEPVALLVAAGLFIGLIFPFGKLAASAGLPPLLYAGAAALCASLVLAILTLASGARLVADGAVLSYAAVAGQLTFAVPFGMLVVVIPHLGSGIPAIFQSTVPIITVLIVLVLGIQRVGMRSALGLLAGLAGVGLIIASRGGFAAAGGDLPPAWLLAALVTPLALAVGNVFRSTHWPAGRTALQLATLTMVAAGLVLLVAHALGIGGGGPAATASAWWLVPAQGLATGLGYAFFFRLQQVGGPVYLSQISYVNTVVGLGFAVAFFGEPFTARTALALALVFAGVALVNSAPERGK